MLFRPLLFLFVLSLCLPLTAQRPGKRVKERAAKRTEARATQRVDQKVDQGVDKVFSSLEGLFSKKKTKKTTPDTARHTDRVEDGGLRANDGDAYADEKEAQNAFSNLLGLGNAEPFEPYRNEVTFTLTMQVTETKKNGKSSVSTVKMGATDTQLMMTMGEEGEGSSRLLFSTEDGKTTTISTDKDGTQTGMRLRMPFGRVTEEIVEEMPHYLTVEATEERKQMDGYDCRKIIITDTKHGTVTTSWITNDLALRPVDVFGGMAKMVGGGKQAFPEPPASLDGFPILSITNDGKTTTEMHLTDIKLGEEIDTSLFSTEGVEIQELGR